MDVGEDGSEEDEDEEVEEEAKTPTAEDTNVDVDRNRNRDRTSIADQAQRTFIQGCGSAAWRQRSNKLVQLFENMEFIPNKGEEEEEEAPRPASEESEDQEVPLLLPTVFERGRKKDRDGETT